MATDDQLRAEIEDEIASLFDHDYCVLVGRGTTALWALFKAISVDNEVLFPSYTCVSAAFAAEFADAQPRFCDVGDDYNMIADAVAASLTDKTDVVVPTDMFGHPVDIEAIAETCGDDVFIVRDACQSIAAPEQIRGQDVVDATVVSFQPKKPIDAGHGGAVLVDDPALADSIRTTVSSLEPSDQQTVDALGETYRELYYTVCDLGAITDDAYDLFYDVSDLFRPLFLEQYDESKLQALDSALNSRLQEAAIRQRHARTYRSELTNPAISHPPSSEQTVHYRYSIRLPSESMRDHVVSRLRELDYHVSTLYKPAHLFFDVADCCPNTERLARQTLNLWVSTQVEADWVSDCAKTVDRLIQSFERE